MDAIDKLNPCRVQVRKSPEHELRNMRPTGIALVPAGANARVCVVQKSADGEQMKLKLKAQAKSSAIAQTKQILDAVNSTFALLTGAEEDETAEPSEELGEMFKAAGDGFHGLAAQYGKKKPYADEEEKKRVAKEAEANAQVDKAGRVLSKKNEDALRGALKNISDILGPLDAQQATSTTTRTQAPATDVAKSDSDAAVLTAIAKSVGDQIKASIEPLAQKLEAVTKAVDVQKGALAPRNSTVVQPGNGAAADEREAAKTREKLPYDPKNLAGTV